MATNHDIPTELFTAIHTACAELPNAHEDDVADCVFGLVDAKTFFQHEAAVMDTIRKLR